MMSHVRFDLAREVRDIKPVWGVNGGPATKAFTFDATELFRRARIPSCRLHDIEYPYGSGEFVDIPCIFKNFDADECDPANYNFALTDLYIQKIRETGATILFRLGVSIEHAPVKRYIYPPRDYEKWARICEHIIRHYNEGFADGHRWGITYWEIWNEADGGDNMWLGSAEEYAELYAVTARHLKACFPHLKIGGGGFTGPRNTFIDRFFQYLVAYPERVPLDFYSWHRYYADIEVLRRSIDISVSLLAEYGYTEAENIFDEWNYMENWSDQGESYRKLTGAEGAAYCAATLCVLQNAPIDAAYYFEADVSKEWCGLFEVAHMAIGKRDRARLAPRKPYAAFETFGRLSARGRQIDTICTEPHIYAVGASDGEGFDGMITVYGGAPEALTLTLEHIPRGSVVRVYRTDAEETQALALEGVVTGEGQSFSLPAAEHCIWSICATYPQ